MDFKSVLHNKTNLLLFSVIVVETVFVGVLIWSRSETREKSIVTLPPPTVQPIQNTQVDTVNEPAYPHRTPAVITLEPDGFTKYVVGECLTEEGKTSKQFTYYLPTELKFKNTNEGEFLGCSPLFYGAEMESYYFPTPVDANRFPVVRFTHPYENKQSVIYAEKSVTGGYDIKTLLIGTKNIVTVDHVEKLRLVYTDVESEGQYPDYNVVANRYALYGSDKKVFVKDIKNNEPMFAVDNLPVHTDLSYAFSNDFKKIAFVTDKGIRVNDGMNEKFIYTDKPVAHINWYQGRTDIDVTTFFKEYDKTKIYFTLQESEKEQDDLSIPIYSIDWDGKNFTKTKNSQYLGW